MNATIEREVSLIMPRCRRVNDATLPDSTQGYKAPMATFMALVASARASARAADTVQVRPDMVGGFTS
jgi:hypothetical protein